MANVGIEPTTFALLARRSEGKVSQFVMHQFPTFISLNFTTLLCISIELLNYLISFNQESAGSISKSNSSPT
jgi:hypothetical protein